MSAAPIDSFRGKYRFLSNFWPCVIEFEGVEYPSTEHAYQAAKTLDPKLREAIRWARTAGEAKKMGGQVKIREDWEQVKLKVMEDVCRLKFQNGLLWDLLLSTGDTELIEGNTWGDQFWGVCNGVGENHLGRILMKIRKELSSNDT
jgi:hypothetical protein